MYCVVAVKVIIISHIISSRCTAGGRASILANNKEI